MVDIRGFPMRFKHGGVSLSLLTKRVELALSDLTLVTLSRISIHGHSHEIQWREHSFTCVAFT